MSSANIHRMFYAAWVTVYRSELLTIFPNIFRIIFQHSRKPLYVYLIQQKTLDVTLFTILANLMIFHVITIFSNDIKARKVTIYIHIGLNFKVGNVEKCNNGNNLLCLTYCL